MAQAIFFTQQEDIGYIGINTPNEKVNVLSEAVLMELDELLKSLAQKSGLRAVVIKSNKPDMFIAGADIKEIQAITTGGDCTATVKRGQDVLNRLAALSVPTIAVIDGPALGGGLELALACDYRVVSDNDKVQLGLPEVNLGVIPGFGGTQRLPRLTGLQNALPIILTGNAVDGKKALKIGLADALYSTAFLYDDLLNFIAFAVTNTGKKNILARRKKAQGGLRQVLLEKNPLGRSVMFSAAEKMVFSKTKGHYPAPLKALDVVRKTYGASLEEGLAAERESFCELVTTSVAKNLIRLFFLQETLKKETGVAQAVTPRTVQSAGVLGAGLMGGGIAWLFSYRKGEVRIKDISWDAIAGAYAAARKIYDKLKEKRKLSAREVNLYMNRISSTTDYTGFKDKGIIIEAVVENMDLKKKVFKELEAQVSDSAIIASNTSSLSITEMATALKRPERFVGMHFFSPVNLMPLVEIIPGEKTSDETIATIVKLTKELKKTPVVVKNCPGFLVNRILIPYVLEAIRLVEEGQQIEGIDAAVEAFGMPLGPLALADEVGLDVGYKVAKVLEEGYGERMAVSPVFERLHEVPDLKGKKSGKGFYIHQGKEKTVNKAIYEMAAPSDSVSRGRSSAEAFSKEDIVDRVILIMVNEAALCLDEKVVANGDYLDMAMILGTGFPPFRGGLCRYADERGLADVVRKLEEFSTRFGSRFEPAPLLRSLAQSGSSLTSYQS